MPDHEMSIEERLNQHPVLKRRMESLLNIVENTSGDTEKADDAELRVIEELRRMGREALHEWAEKRESVLSEEFRENKDAAGHGKKKFHGARHTEQ